MRAAFLAVLAFGSAVRLCFGVQGLSDSGTVASAQPGMGSGVDDLGQRGPGPSELLKAFPALVRQRRADFWGTAHALVVPLRLATCL